MSSKIRIKVGPVEVEYEGDEKFFKDEFPQILSKITQLVKEAGIDLISETIPKIGVQSTTQHNAAIGTTGTIAAKLGVSSGSELILAASARLTLGQNIESFARDQLLTEMKTAKAYYKTSYMKNYSVYLSGLVKAGKLMETSKDTYALSAIMKEELENKLVK
jgi:hypothetical protein